MTHADQRMDLTGARKTVGYLRLVFSQVAQDVLLRLDKALKAFFAKRAGRPKFKAIGRYSSITYPQAYKGCIKLGITQKKIYVSKVGYIPIVVHHDPPDAGKLKTCTIKLESGGEWHAILVYTAAKAEEGEQPREITNPVGIELGLTSIIATSDGKVFEPLKPLVKAEKNLKRHQRRLSRRRGSRNREKQRHRLARHHAKVARQRRDFNHKLSNELVKDYDFFAIEDLNVKGLLRNHCLAKAISDASWGQLVEFIQYKAAHQSKTWVLVNPRNSTQECSRCGYVLTGERQLTLNDRIFRCPACGNTMDRDVNAARVILKRGLSEIGRGTPEFTPTEMGPPLLPGRAGASPVDEVGTGRGNR